MKKYGLSFILFMCISISACGNSLSISKIESGIDEEVHVELSDESESIEELVAKEIEDLEDEETDLACPEFYSFLFGQATASKSPDFCDIGIPSAWSTWDSYSNKYLFAFNRDTEFILEDLVEYAWNMDAGRGNSISLGYFTTYTKGNTPVLLLEINYVDWGEEESLILGFSSNEGDIYMNFAVGSWSRNTTVFYNDLTVSNSGSSSAFESGGWFGCIDDKGMLEVTCSYEDIRDYGICELVNCNDSIDDDSLSEQYLNIINTDSTTYYYYEITDNNLKKAVDEYFSNENWVYTNSYNEEIRNLMVENKKKELLKWTSLY